MVVLIISSAAPAFALVENAELVITDIWLEPPHPQAGEKVTIFGNVYNGGNLATENFASVVTYCFFIDDEKRKVGELGNVKIGESNSVTISSGPVWDAEWGEHKFKAIIDCHDTLQDSIDNPKNNEIEKIFFIEPFRESEFFLNVSPSHVIPGKHQQITVNGTIFEKKSNLPLIEQEVILHIADSEISLTSNENGQFSITKAITFTQDKTLITSFFEGDFPHLPTNQSKIVHTLPSSEDNSAIVLKMIDPLGRYDFSNLSSEIAVFQDSYDTLFSKLLTNENNVMLDDSTVWFGIDGNHSYLEEVYVEGRYFFTVDWSYVPDNGVIEKILNVPSTAQIRFLVNDVDKNPIAGANVENWIYSGITDQNGFTEWIDMLPTRSKDEPYVAVVSTDDGKILRSDPFYVSSEEKKIVEIITKPPEPKIPQWIRNNAKWWSNEQISTNDFITGIQYLIQRGIIVVPAAQVDEETTERGVPPWVKNNAKWWSEGLISDNEFILGLQHLIKIGVIRV